MESLEGHLLVSAPELPDVFHHAVVLLVRHNSEGAFGLILNRPTDTGVREIWAKVSESACQVESNLRVGGPVDGPLMCLHDQEIFLEMEVLPGVYFSANRDKLEQLAVRSEARQMYFIGYAGWSPGQLEGELERGSWGTLPARHEHIFESDETLWDQLRRELSDIAMREQLGIKHVPPDLRMN